MKENLMYLGLISGLVFVFGVTANAENNIQYPIAELGGCASEDTCRTYCDSEKNVERCLNFAEENNLMSDQELEEARKFLSLGAGPGGCKSENECESYCNDVSNIRECITFAEKNGLMSGDELKEAKQIIKALDSGAKLPGGCSNEKSCDAYCSNEANILECVTFAEAAGFISEEEAAMVKKTGGKGPGGCHGRECENYCSDPQNSEVCYKFAKEYGLMTPEMEKGSNEFLDSLKNAPAEVKSCMESTFGNLNQIFPGPKTGAKLRECYEVYSRKNPGKAYWPAQEGQQQMTGPGGCRNREECDAYCIANPLECRPADGQTMPPQSGEGVYQERVEVQGEYPPPTSTEINNELPSPNTNQIEPSPSPESAPELPPPDGGTPPEPVAEPEPVTYSPQAGLASILWIFEQLIAR